MQFPTKTPTPKRQRAPVVPGWRLQLRGHAHIRAPWEKINIHLIIILLRALSCIRVVMNAFMFHVCAGRPYTTFVTTHSKMCNPYISYRKNVECGNQVSSSCDSPLNLLLHLAHVQYLHTGQLVGCWNRLETELLTRSVIRFRVRHASDYKSRTELSITGVSRHHTLKRCYLHLYTVAPLEPSRVDKHDNQYYRSVGGRYQCSCHSLS